MVERERKALRIVDVVLVGALVAEVDLRDEGGWRDPRWLVVNELLLSPMLRWTFASRSLQRQQSILTVLRHIDAGR
jgi:hypothetical protein